jgi:Acetyltransferase (GNAT) family
MALPHLRLRLSSSFSSRAKMINLKSICDQWHSRRSWSALTCHDHGTVFEVRCVHPDPIFNHLIFLSEDVDQLRQTQLLTGWPLTRYTIWSKTPFEILPGMRWEQAKWLNLDRSNKTGWALNENVKLKTSDRYLVVQVENTKDLIKWVNLESRVFKFSDFQEKLWLEMQRDSGFGPSTPWRHFYATDGINILGTISWYVQQDSLELHNLSVRADRRGRGIGNLLVEHSLVSEEARSREVIGLTNKESMRFQRRYNGEVMDSVYIGTCSMS